MRSSASRLSSFSSRDSLWNRMPDQISVSEFIAETTEDYNSPTTSSFTTRLHNCRNTVTLLEELHVECWLDAWAHSSEHSVPKSLLPQHHSRASSSGMGMCRKCCWRAGKEQRLLQTRATPEFPSFP
ncbi:arf-GAP with SH3 domain, ANK repeat and PH domain-containing protein 1 isoform X6 [Ictidomys tridecemlineatus]|uniref:arf-GAP with SH3 domain, ANK repeat and PH domain-containing protein 1 isoform X9 n=1 Tax=Ictidomys tridecemlineatus TaxID=43179 RepID=UPI001A9F5FAE|nr:arf-GAP with SH3 domain, ANK repeat and PH domain-containing protein 1 isoform X9 [Ictidomys tridecemlineatus]